MTRKQPLNYTELEGRVHSIDSREFGEKKVVSLRLVVPQSKKVGDDYESDNWFISCDTWDADTQAKCEKIRERDQVCVCGKLKFERWADKDGNKRERIKLILADVRLADDEAPAQKPEPKQQDLIKVDSRVVTQTQIENPVKPPAKPEEPVVEEDDVPF